MSMMRLLSDPKRPDLEPLSRYLVHYDVDPPFLLPEDRIWPENASLDRGLYVLYYGLKSSLSSDISSASTFYYTVEEDSDTEFHRILYRLTMHEVGDPELQAYYDLYQNKGMSYLQLLHVPKGDLECERLHYLSLHSPSAFMYRDLKVRRVRKLHKSHFPLNRRDNIITE